MSYKTFKEMSNQTLKGAALLQLLQSAAGADDTAAIVYGGAAAFTAGVGNAVTALSGMTAGTAVTVGTVLTLSAVTGVVMPGDVVSDSSSNSATIIGPVVPGTDGAGAYNIVAPVVAWVAGGISVTGTSQILSVTAVTANDAPLLANGGNIGTIPTSGSVVAANVTTQVTPNSGGFTGEAAGGIGRYNVSVAQKFASTTVDMSTNTMHVTAQSAGDIGGGNAITAPSGASALTVLQQILPLTTGEYEGGIGRYFVGGGPAYVASVNTFTTASATAMVDGDYIALFDGSWTGRSHYEFNNDVFTKYGRKFVVKFMTTTALTLGDSSLNNTTIGTAGTSGYGIVRQVTVTAHSMVPGNVFMVGTEALLVLNVNDANHIDVYRGYAGTTVAAHASGAAVLAPAAWTNVNVGYDLVLPITSLTLATAAPQVVKAMNALDGWNAKWFGSVGQGVQQSLSSKKLFLDWEYDTTYDDRIIFHRESVAGAIGPGGGTTVMGSGSLPVDGGTSVFILASIANGACPTAMTPGVQAAEVGSSVVLRIPTAGECAAAGSGGAYGRMDFAFKYPVRGYVVLGFVTSTGAVTADTADWIITKSTDGRRLSIAGVASHVLAVTETVGFQVYF